MDTRSFVNSLGSSDVLYTNEAKSTYFRTVYSQSSHFAEQMMTLQFPKNYFYGDEVLIDLYKNGDIIQGVYIYLTFSNSGVPCVESAGTYAIDYAQLEYETEVIERLDGDFLDIANDIYVPQGKQNALGQLVGKGRTTLNTTYAIKLPFSCMDVGLPVCALEKNPYIRFKFRQPSEFITGYSGSLALNAKLVVSYAFLPKAQRDYFKNTTLLYLIEQSHRTNFQVGVSEIVSANKTNKVNLTSTLNILSTAPTACTYSLYFTTPYDYSDRFNSNVTFTINASEYPINTGGYTMTLNNVLVSTAATTPVSNTFSMIYTGSLSGGTNYTANLVCTSSANVQAVTCTFSGTYYTTEAQPITVFTDFSHPVKELFFIIQSDGATPYNYKLGTLDQFVNMRMVLNGYEVIPTNLGTPIFMRVLQGLENHTRSPDRYFYMYPFALDPENSDPTGSVNFNALVRQQFDFSFRKTSPEVARNVKIYARVHNLMRIQDGKLNILYDRKDADAVRNIR